MKGTSWRSVEFLVSHCGRICRQISEGVRPWIWQLRKSTAGKFKPFFPQNRRGSGTSSEPLFSRPGSRRKRSRDAWDSSFQRDDHLRTRSQRTSRGYHGITLMLLRNLAANARELLIEVGEAGRTRPWGLTLD